MRNSHFPVGPDGGLPHLRVAPNSIPDTVILVGDPGRMDLLARIWNGAIEINSNREYRLIRGFYEGTELACCSTGIGGPAMEIAVVELKHAGVKNLLRSGGCSGLLPTLKLGQIILNLASVNGTGVANAYVPPGYPAVSDMAWLEQIPLAAKDLSIDLISGVGITTDSYYAGQNRPHESNNAHVDENWAQFWTSRGVTHVDMESAALLSIGRALHLRCASLLAVHANRANNTWLEEYRSTELRLLTLASHAAKRLKVILS